MSLVVHVATARSDFVQLASTMRALALRGTTQRLVYTGHRGDARLRDLSLQDLGLPEPDTHLEVGPGPVSRVELTAKVMLALEHILVEPPRPDWLLVPGDGDSSLAAALTGTRLSLRIAHLEAGLRGLGQAPSERNGIAIDHLADLLLTPSPDADRRLAEEGIPPERIVCVGAAAIDNLFAALPSARERAIPEQLGLEQDGYAVATLEQDADATTLARLVRAFGSLARKLPVVFPIAPPTRARLPAPLPAGKDAVLLPNPFGYVDFVSLLLGARLVLTDSGELAGEAAVLGIPCLILREKADRPITLEEEATSQLVGTDPSLIAEVASRALTTPPPRRCPALWDGRTGKRVAQALLERS
ncbi:MAG TPA: UDP-N-acetylglucosamine 2-epimerase [Anaeromyxobacteraceae bacterium]|nr:UDP-N-acetylglucosamine 2-epimerase [Anaeromyxobacteraceae bacterium]